MRYVAGQPAERILPPGSFASIGQALPPGEPLSTEERIRILVWNIYKQQRAEWLSVLKNYGKDAHLVLLQEAQTTPELVQFATVTILPPSGFNAWSRRRMNALYRFAREMSLRQVRFTDDQRRRAFGRPLDFVFYRGLNVSEASVLVTRASDHNPLLVEFSPGKPDK